MSCQIIGRKKRARIDRPINLLYPLECDVGKIRRVILYQIELNETLR